MGDRRRGGVLRACLLSSGSMAFARDASLMAPRRQCRSSSSEDGSVSGHTFADEYTRARRTVAARDQAYLDVSHHLTVHCAGNLEEARACSQ